MCHVPTASQSTPCSTLHSSSIDPAVTGAAQRAKLGRQRPGSIGVRSVNPRHGERREHQRERGFGSALP